MGKGDKRTKRGKIIKGSYGVTRRREDQKKGHHKPAAAEAEEAPAAAEAQEA